MGNVEFDRQPYILEGSGFCSYRLQNIDTYLQRIVEKKMVAGVGALVIRHGKIAYRKSFGMQDIEQKIPMANDSIYRICSMTKTFTIVAAMSLYEKGYFKLHDPIEEYLPSFASMKVAQHDERGFVKLVPVKTPITFHHLFTMTSGFPFLLYSDNYSGQLFSDIIAREVKKLGGWDSLTTEKIVELASQVPLCFHPGEYWMYGFNHEILGRLIEIISGKKFSQYIEEVISKPLGLTDTDFYVPQHKQNRLCKVYAWNEGNLSHTTDLHINANVDPGISMAPAFESGGAGLASTLDDLGRYGQMLLNGGKFNGVRILSRKTIELIKRNHVSLDLTKKYGLESMSGYGYGLGVRTMLDTVTAGINGSSGEWAWGGALGTWYCLDPIEDLVAIFLIQRRPGGNTDLPKRFIQTVYGAIDD
jgi:CubicO group peptidase (beta-lactamase class C family)